MIFPFVIKGVLLSVVIFKNNNFIFYLFISIYYIYVGWEFC